jgi:hypothetical protein
MKNRYLYAKVFLIESGGKDKQVLLHTQTFFSLADIRLFLRKALNDCARNYQSYLLSAAIYDVESGKQIDVM